ncbi:hypothetical protein DPSP01_007282 [Paraphaeosphaeria sporulosa]|uniref:Uncharacterized protein n=1 Tax=Paraphaeosphaeria sporulosa TaxID=1460663 RepID=A0A177C502_9PLEO|nr:uncharacterized protein CC84DRAFT_1220590 [Paraphaeosphaeria sporulosa]OAG02241.1 hypothetical protein CC84DRAFT_1220590 [Paraphaeosphaeria sporulosa]
MAYLPTVTVTDFAMPRRRARFNIGLEDDTVPSVHTLRHLVSTGIEQIRDLKTVLMTIWEQAEEIERALDQANDALKTMDARETASHERESARQERRTETNGVLHFPALRSPRGTEMGFPGLM